MNKNEMILEVQNSAASLFTKDDVINLINKLSTTTHIDWSIIKHSIVEETINALTNLDPDDLVDFDSADFRLEDNTIVLYHVDIQINESHIRNTIGDVFDDITEEYLNDNEDTDS